MVKFFQVHPVYCYLFIVFCLPIEPELSLSLNLLIMSMNKLNFVPMNINTFIKFELFSHARIRTNTCFRYFSFSWWCHMDGKQIHCQVPMWGTAVTNRRSRLSQEEHWCLWHYMKSTSFLSVRGFFKGCTNTLSTVLY